MINDVVMITLFYTLQMSWSSAYILYYSCWSFCKRSGPHIKRHLRHWWCSHLPPPASPERHTWPLPLQQLSPRAHPGSPTSLRTEEEGEGFELKWTSVAAFGGGSDNRSATNLSKYSVKAPSAGVYVTLWSRCLFESSISRLCPLAHRLRLQFRSFSFHHEHKLYPHECEWWNPEE